MNTQKQKYSFITRYSLMPDIQIDLDTINGITKEDKFMDWLITFPKEKRKEIDYHEPITPYTAKR